MAEGGMGTLPQVFVVDSHLNYASIPSKKGQRWARVGQKSLLLLVGLTMLGIAVQGVFIYKLYKKTEVKLISVCLPVCFPACLLACLLVCVTVSELR